MSSSVCPAGELSRRERLRWEGCGVLTTAAGLQHTPSWLTGPAAAAAAERTPGNDKPELLLA